MLFTVALLTANLIWAVCCGLAVNRRFSTWKLHYRILAILAPAGLPLLVLSWMCQVLRVTDFEWNQARLAPLFALWHGYSLYYPADQGPVMGAIYGPLAYLAYFPSLIAKSPIPALLTGSAVASFYFLAPVVWIFTSGPFRRQEGRWVGVFFLALFGFWTIGSSPLHYCCFNIHADAPALGFGAVACGLLMREGRSARMVLLAALFTALAIFSKQSLLFLAPALACFVWIADGRRLALVFAAGTAVVGAVVLGIFSALYSAPVLYFNLYAFASHHGFGDGPLMHIPEKIGAHYAAGVLARVGLKFWEYGRWLILMVAVCCAVELHVEHHGKLGAAEWLRRNRWVIFHFVALAGLPFAIIFGAKVGGDINAYGLYLYFGTIGLLLFAAHVVLQHPGVSRPAAILSVVLAATIMPTAIVSLDIPELTRKLRLSNEELIYQYATKHPGETYFSSYPLPVLMAEGRMYHFDYGIFDRELGHARVSQSHFLEYVPPHLRYLQKKTESPIIGYLPEFSCPAAQAALAGWTFYADCSGRQSLR